MKIESLAGQQQIFEQTPYILSTKERLQRAFKASGMFFGAAVVAVFIPGLHFFLVPLFLILTVYFGYKRFKEVRRVDLSSVNCPVCQKKLKETLMYTDEDVFRLYCYECQNQLRVT